MKQKSIDWLALVALGSFLQVGPTYAAKGPARISSGLLNLAEVHKIYLAHGLAAVVQLPYPITEVKVGSPEDVQVQISKTLPSELTLVLKREASRGTNLIARCGSRTFVFDLIPSKKTHQDLVRISGSYGAPELSDMGAVLIESSEKGSEVTRKVKEPASADMVLIDSSSKEVGR